MSALGRTPPRRPAGEARGARSVGARTARWPDHSRLFAVGDGGGWSVEEDARARRRRRLGASASKSRRRAGRGSRRGSPSSSRATSRRSAVAGSTRRIGSRPRTCTAARERPVRRSSTTPSRRSAGSPTGSRGCRSRTRRCASSSSRRASTASASSRIPLGIDLEHFPLVDAERRAARAATRSASPSRAFVVGSFQKDGVGWGEGLEPKLVKGPDVLVAALERLREDVPGAASSCSPVPLAATCAASSSGLGVPYRHVSARSRDELARAYHALDVYLVSSRQEGGPKAVLESMAAGVPLVTTRVGPGAGDRPARRGRLARGRGGRRRARRDRGRGAGRGTRGCASRPRDGRGARARAARRALGRAPRRLRRRATHEPLTLQRVAGAAYRRVPRRPFRYLMPTRLMRGPFRFWLSVLGSRPRPPPRRARAADHVRRRVSRRSTAARSSTTTASTRSTG